MKNKADRRVPGQRTMDLVVRSQGEGTLILDRRTDTAHYLPAEVTRVWGACTGNRTLAEVASAAAIDEQIAASAVDQLIELDLLDVPAGIDRRKFLGRSALVGAGVVVIESVVAPMPHAAATGPPIVILPASISCVSALNTGPTTNTNRFDFRLQGVPATGVGGAAAQYMITFSSERPFDLWRSGAGGGGASVGSVIVPSLTVSQSAPTIYHSGPNTLSLGAAGSINGAPLPSIVTFTITTQSLNVEPPINIVQTYTYDNPCCPPPGCQVPEEVLDSMPGCSTTSPNQTVWGGVVTGFPANMPFTVTLRSTRTSTPPAGPVSVTIPIMTDATGSATIPTQNVFPAGAFAAGGTTMIVYLSDNVGPGRPWALYHSTIGPCPAPGAAAPLPRKATSSPPRQATPHPPPSTSPSLTPRTAPSTRPSSTAPPSSSSPSP